MKLLISILVLCASTSAFAYTATGSADLLKSKKWEVTASWEPKDPLRQEITLNFTDTMLMVKVKCLFSEFPNMGNDVTLNMNVPITLVDGKITLAQPQIGSVNNNAGNACKFVFSAGDYPYVVMWGKGDIAMLSRVYHAGP